MKNFLFISLLLISGCTAIVDVSNKNSLKIVEVTECWSDSKYYYYKVRDVNGVCYKFFSNERFLVGDSVKLVKTEQEAEISSDPKE